MYSDIIRTLVENYDKWRAHTIGINPELEKKQNDETSKLLIQVYDIVSIAVEHVFNKTKEIRPEAMGSLFEYSVLTESHEFIPQRMFIRDGVLFMNCRTYGMENMFSIALDVFDSDNFEVIKEKALEYVYKKEQGELMSLLDELERQTKDVRSEFSSMSDDYKKIFRNK